MVAAVIGAIVAIRALSGRLLQHSTPEEQQNARNFGNALLSVPKYFMLAFFLYVTYVVFLAPDRAGHADPDIGRQKIEQS